MEQISLKDLVENFCKCCWNPEINQTESFLSLSKALKKRIVTTAEKSEIIPLLIEKSYVYPKLVFLANDFFQTLTEEEQQNLKIPMIYWINDEGTEVTEAEYKNKRFGINWRRGNKYYRTSDETDFRCFYKVVQMIFKSNNSPFQS